MTRVNPDVATPITPELLDWAELIFVMEQGHRVKLTRRFPGNLRDKRIICLDIPDSYDYMEPELVDMLTSRVPRYLTG